MKYRLANPNDLKACEECIASTEYYPPVDLASLRGMVLLAENEAGIQGVVWAAVSGARAYTDFLAVRPEVNAGLGIRLIVRGVKLLERIGVKEIYSTVHYSNKEAIKLNARLGKVDGPYALSIIPVGRT